MTPPDKPPTPPPTKEKVGKPVDPSTTSAGSSKDASSKSSKPAKSAGTPESRSQETTSGFANSTLRLTIGAHLIKVRLARILPHPMTKAGRTPQELAEVRKLLSAPTFSLNPVSFVLKNAPTVISDSAAMADGVRMHAAYGTPDEISMKVGSSTWRETNHGFTFAAVGEKEMLTVTLRCKDVLAIPPRGPKLLCLSNIDTSEVDTASYCHAIVLMPSSGSDGAKKGDVSTKEGEVTLSINGGLYKDLKVLSIFPYARFRVLKSVYDHERKTLGTMRRYMDLPPTNISSIDNDNLALEWEESDIKPNDIMDTDGNAGFGDQTGHQMRAISEGSNLYIAVAEDFGLWNRFVIGFRTNYGRRAGVQFPPMIDIGYRPHVGNAYLYQIVREVAEVSLARRKIFAAFSGIEGPTDSINTFDDDNRISWGVLNWISSDATNLPNLLTFLYSCYPKEFGTRFSWYGFSVWYDKESTESKSNVDLTLYSPFQGASILFPGCHGPVLKASLENMRNATWRNCRSLYGNWVFRMAGQDFRIQEGQVRWANRRFSAHFHGEKLNDLSEKRVAELFALRINPGSANQLEANGKTMAQNRNDAIAAFARSLNNPLSTTDTFNEATLPAASSGSTPSSAPEVHDVDRTLDWLKAIPDPTPELLRAPSPDRAPVPERRPIPTVPVFPPIPNPDILKEYTSDKHKFSLPHQKPHLFDEALQSASTIASMPEDVVGSSSAALTPPGPLHFPLPPGSDLPKTSVSKKSTKGGKKDTK